MRWHDCVGGNPHFLSLISSSETPAVVIPLKRHIVRTLLAACSICQAGVHYMTSARRSVHKAFFRSLWHFAVDMRTSCSHKITIICVLSHLKFCSDCLITLMLSCGFLFSMMISTCGVFDFSVVLQWMPCLFFYIHDDNVHCFHTTE